METERERLKGRRLSSHQLLEKSHDGPMLPDHSMLTGCHSSGGEETGGRKSCVEGETEREEERESGGGRERERLMKNTGMGGRQKN